MRTKARTNPNTAETNGRLAQLAHAGWHRTARKLATCATCALVIGSLALPNAALAAEWLEVGGSHYDAGTAAGDDAGTWSWDGANDLQLNGYDGSDIYAAGRLDVSYTGENTISAEEDGIYVEDGVGEDAELNITGDGTLNITAEDFDAIHSEGDLSISGSGTINATSESEVAINASGDLSITGSGNVNANGYYDAIRADGNVTIDSTGNVVANGAVRGEANEDDDPSGFGIYAEGDLRISGGGTVEASASCDNALYSVGDMTIEESRVTAAAGHNEAITSEGTLTIAKKAFVTASAATGVYAYKGLVVDNSTLRASGKSETYTAQGIYVDEGGIDIRNGSHVEASAHGDRAAAIESTNYISPSDELPSDGGRISISNSTVTATATLVTDARGRAYGIIARNSELNTPASIGIVNSNVTASGANGAILALSESRVPDGPSGTITITDSTITLPANGLVNDLFVALEGPRPADARYYRGQVIGTADDLINDFDDPAIARDATITANRQPEEQGPASEDPKGPGKTEGEKDTDMGSGGSNGNGNGANVSQASAKKQGGKLPQTGDSEGIAAAAIAAAGAAVVGTGLAISRKRQ